MIELQVGDIVKHNNMPDRLRIRTLKGGVCTCEFIDRPKMHYVGLEKEDYERCICKVENLVLEVDENQLSLFS